MISQFLSANIRVYSTRDTIDNNVNSFELFDTKIKQETELISSPKSLVSDAERSSDTKSSNNQTTTTEDPGMY
ncbi:hypothetical protein V9T40_014718 [Parthenolecanium corni]|uniref:Uncharacterized protein n=1 Tax=Parthenolecanium corni TaxID=536013 RepID=A0AAN9XWN6_9HEMI